MMPTIKRGDAAADWTLTLGVDLTDYSTATVILRRYGHDPVTIAGTIADAEEGTVAVDLTSTHTAEVGDYRVEVEMAPGPHTFPSTGFLVLSVVEDLNP